MAWPGGKDGSGVAQRLINEIPPHDVFVSPFLGDCAILRKKRPAAESIGIDLDRSNVARWAKSPPVPGLRLFCTDAIAWLRHAFDLDEVPTVGTAARSRDAAGGGDGHLVRSPNSSAEASTSRGGRSTNGRRRSPVPAAGSTAERSSGSRFGVGRSIFVYADPPYMHATRTKKAMYAHEMTDVQHAELVATLAALPCLVMVSHYPHPLYAQAFAGWRTFTYRSMTRGGKLATEQVWCNYAPPAELHDARYLGRNKREREKIRRRVRNWSAGLARMPALERQAIIDAIAGR